MKIFETVKEIRSREGLLHFKRFAIIEIKNFFSIYIHRIYQHDKDPFLHTHPWNFFGIVLKGGYVEKTPEGLKEKSVGSIGFGDRTYLHKIHSLTTNSGAVTLFFVWGKNKDWYYKIGKDLIHNQNYRENKDEYIRSQEKEE